MMQTAMSLLFGTARPCSLAGRSTYALLIRDFRLPSSSARKGAAVMVTPMFPVR